MAGKRSAGILLYRFQNKIAEVLLVHPGGPFWAKKDAGAWSIPKGEFTDDEDPLTAAKREFEEELGSVVEGDFIELRSIKLKSGKTVFAWAAEGDFNPVNLKSNTFEMEWPPKSGKKQLIPEVDRCEWFTLEIAKQKINEQQQPFINQLQEILTAKKL